MVEPDRSCMEAIAALVEGGGLRVHVARTFLLCLFALMVTAYAAKAHSVLRAFILGLFMSCQQREPRLVGASR
jgi:hypothetical protein